MNRRVLICTLCAVLSSFWLENVDAQLSSEQDSGSIIQSVETLSKVIQALQIEIKMKSSVISKLVSKKELESILLNNLATKSDMQIHDTSFKNLEAKAAIHDNSLSNLQATVDELKTLLMKPREKEYEQLTSLSNLEFQTTMQTLSLNNVGAHLENPASVIDNFLTKDEMKVNNFTNMKFIATTASDGEETLAEEIENATASNDIVEGIFAGTHMGAVIIPFDSREPITISSSETNGVAFNWQNHKVYWIESEVGIKIADLDGSGAEVLISDPNLRGLAVDQITGNLYFGVKGTNSSIRVCDSMGKKCVTIASEVNNLVSRIWDVALYPSQGIMFWSNSWDKGSITRANMDGTNAIEIVLEPTDGLYLDEFTEKLYWANFMRQSIGHGDLNLNNRNHLLNTTIYPYDVAVDGDTMYFGGLHPNGVYSVTSNGEVSPILKTNGAVYHIALFRKNKAFSRPNPCEDSPCANLCVLDRVSHTCL